MSTTITLEGNIAGDIALKTTPNGHAVAAFSVAVSNREKKAGEWVDASATYHNIEAWNTLAEHIDASLSKGDAVLVTGIIRTHTWEDKDKDTGQKPSRNIITATNAGPSLKYTTAAVQKAQRRSDTEPAGN